MRLVLRSMRPHQWVKNLFVLIPLVFARRVLSPATLELDWETVGSAFAAFAVFCAASGAVYLLNDLVDVEKDRQHPVKRNRPIASGALAAGRARGALIAIGGIALAASVAIHIAFAGIVLGYVALNLAYSFRLKHVPFVDVFSIAGGFLLRVAGGAAAIAVPVTAWLYATTFLLAAFLALGKRSHELRVAGELAGTQRRVLLRYRADAIEWGLWAFGVATAATYVAYTMSAHAHDQFDGRPMELTIPFIVFGLWRFLALAKRQDTPESPTELMIRDTPFLLNLGLWAMCVVAIIYAS